MAKNKNKKQRRSSKLVVQKEEIQQETIDTDVKMSDELDQDDTGEKITLANIDAMSDSDDDEAAEWDAEALALRNAIAEGAFDKLDLDKLKEDKGKSDDDDDDDDGEGPVALEDDSSVDDDEKDDKDDKEEENPQSNSERVAKKALQIVANELVSAKKAMPWPERMDVVSPTPLPFGKKNEEGEIIQIHDDLKREVIFYNMALEAVHEARGKCEESNIPFSRPEDFFAEMVKTDGMLK